MTWWHLESAARNNLKLKAAGKDALGLWVLCGLYAAEQHTDGFVPQSEFDGIVRAWGFPAEAVKAAMKDGLVPGKAALIESVQHGVCVHDYGDYNPPAKEIKRLSMKRSRAGRKGAEVKHSSPGKCQKQVPEASAIMASAGSVGRSVGRSVDPVATEFDLSTVPGCTSAVAAVWNAEMAKAIKGHKHDPAPPGVQAAAEWVQRRGLTMDELRAYIKRHVAAKKPLPFLPSAADQYDLEDKSEAEPPKPKGWWRDGIYYGPPMKFNNGESPY